MKVYFQNNHNPHIIPSKCFYQIKTIQQSSDSVANIYMFKINSRNTRSKSMKHVRVNFEEI